MASASFASEFRLQGLIAADPTIIPASACASPEPRRWLLVQREARIHNPAAPNAPWHVDILLIDQDAVLTLVEVKLAPQGTSARRQNLGQLIDYVAGARATWNARTLASAYATISAGDPLHLTRHTPFAPHEFWQRAEKNLKASRLRIIYAANQPPAETVTAIELLNAQLRTIEVYAVRIDYASDGRAYGVIAHPTPPRSTAPAPKPNTRRTPYHVLEPGQLEDHLDLFRADADPRMLALTRLASDLGYTIKRKTRRGRPESSLYLYPRPDSRALFTLYLGIAKEHGGGSFDFSPLPLQDAGLTHPRTLQELESRAAPLGSKGLHLTALRFQAHAQYEAFRELIRWTAEMIGLTQRSPTE